MADAETINELDKRIQTVRAQIHLLIEQETTRFVEGAAVKQILPDRITAQFALLVALAEEREAAAAGVV
jgi:hypothetical protein